MSTFCFHHGQSPTLCTSFSSPFLRSKPTFFLSPPLFKPPLYLQFHPTRPPPPPVVVNSQGSHRWWAREEDPTTAPVAKLEDQDIVSSEESENPEDDHEMHKSWWTEHGWAPWEQILSVEADFARKSLDEGEEVPLTSPEAIEAFKMLTPSYRKKKIAEIGEEEYIRRLFAIKGEIPEKLKTVWAGPLAVQLIPPRDWPPNGWEVDKKELEFIREAHRLQSERVDLGGGDNWIGAPGFDEKLKETLEAGKEIYDAVFGENKELEMKYKEWVKSNPDRLNMNETMMLIKNDVLKQYREWVSSNKFEGSEEEGIDQVEKAVRMYEKFMKQHEEQFNADVENAKQEANNTVNQMAFERYKTFVKQYIDWVEANRDRLEEESYKFDQDYYPGRRKRGKDYKEEMLELPFIYPGQVYQGKVISISLHQGAFVDIGCVHDGWVPIKGNDWYWLRHHIEVGMPVLVEILAKRDPYRFRFPIEMRFLQPNIDHLIFNRFEFPPIFHRGADTNPLERQRESGRGPIPSRRPEGQVEIEKQPLISDHPYVDELWHIHAAEQMILDHEEENPDKFKDKKFEETVDHSFDEENSVEYTQTYYEGSLIPKVILKTNMKDLNLDAARAERQRIKKLKKLAEQTGKKFEVSKLRRNLQMDEYDLLHWRRSLEEREALIRDISCRTAAGLPLEEPGKYIDDPEFWGKEFHKSNPLYRVDLHEQEKKNEKIEKDKAELEAHYRSVLGGKHMKWYEMSYDGYMARKAYMEKKARLEELKRKKEEEALRMKKDAGELESEEEDADDYDDDIDFDYSILGTPHDEAWESESDDNGTSPSMDDIDE